MIELKLDALAEHVRDVVWTTEGELGLKTCQQGCPEQLRTPDDLAEAIPAVFLDPPKWSGGAPDQADLPAMEGTVTLRLTFLRPIAIGEEHPRTTVQQLQKIAALFAEPGFKLSGWDDSAGLEVDKIWPSDVAHEHDLNYEDSALRVALGSITLQAKVIAYDPAG